VKQRRHLVYLLLAVMAGAGAALCWSGVWSLVDVPPIADGEPATVSIVYHPPLLVITWLLATTAGVLTVLGVAGLRRRYHSATLVGYTP